MSSSLNLWIFGLINNITGSVIGDSCNTGNSLPGICTPLYGCPSALRELQDYQYPTYCSRNSVIPTVCCPNEGNGPHIPRYPNPSVNFPIGYPNPTVPQKPLQYPPVWRPDLSIQSTTENPIYWDENHPTTPSDHITFHRLAERKCAEYASDEYIYENITTIDYNGNPVTSYDPCPGLFLIGPAVVGGTMATPKEYPHMALLGYGTDEETSKWLCGGTIISLRFILTAAHCINTSKGSPTYVRIGDLDHSTTSDDAAPQTIAVSRSIPHENYRSPYVYNDIGLLELAYNIQMNAYARPACLATDELLPMEIVIATGWGRTQFGGQSSPTLMEVDLDQFSYGECSNTYKASVQLPAGLNKDSQLCAGSRYEAKDTCSGDSGGPLQVLHNEHKCMYKIVGVTSFGRGCGNIGVPGVYTKVAHYIEWIEERAFVYG